MTTAKFFMSMVSGGFITAGLLHIYQADNPLPIASVILGLIIGAISAQEGMD